jgi:acetyl-CoA carboxylase biotin carboxyl carrier protein
MAEKPNQDKPARFDTGLIRELAAILREADLGEIEIQQGELRIRVTKPEPAPVTVTAPALAPAHASAAPAVAAPAGPAPGATKPAADHPGVVKSPMVGTVYLAPETGAATFIKVGDSVNPGQTLLLVEAMKTFNPVTAPRGGKVVQIIVANEQPVEFGEPLVVIE